MTWDNLVMTQPTPQTVTSPSQPAYVIATQQPMLRTFTFDGGAGTYLGIVIGAALLTLFTLGFGAPWAICMRYRWRCEHTLIDGRRLRFTGHGGGLFGNWIKWLLLCFITLGIYGFWVAPRLTKWIVEHQEVVA